MKGISGVTLSKGHAEHRRGRLRPFTDQVVNLRLLNCPTRGGEMERGKETGRTAAEELALESVRKLQRGGRGADFCAPVKGQSLRPLDGFDHTLKINWSKAAP